jgi:hypothetical protein
LIRWGVGLLVGERHRLLKLAAALRAGFERIAARQSTLAESG